MRVLFCFLFLVGPSALAAESKPRCDACEDFQTLCINQCKVSTKNAPPRALPGCIDNCKKVSNDCKKDCTQKKRR